MSEETVLETDIVNNEPGHAAKHNDVNTQVNFVTDYLFNGGLAASYGHAAASALIPVSDPSGFTWTDHPLADDLFVDQYGVFRTTFDPTTRKHVGGVTYWVDGVLGNDANTGLSDGSGNALQSIATAAAKSDVGTIMVKGNGVATPYYRGRGFNNAAQAKNLNIIGHGTSEVYITTHDVLTFTLTAAQTYTYQTTRSSVTEVMDMIAGAPGERLVKRTSIAEVEANPGSWWQSGSTLYVHAADSRNLNTTNAGRIWALLNVNNFKNVGDYTTYLENLNLYGGTDVIRCDGATSTGGQVTLVNVGVGLSQQGYNNVSFNGCDAVLVDCDSRLSGADGYNYHAANGKVPDVVELNCRATDCGHTTSDQCTSMHDGGRIIRVGGSYRNATAATVADVTDGTESWNLGCEAEGAGSGFANWHSGLAGGGVVKMWLHACTARDGHWSVATFGDGEAYLRGSRVERVTGAVTDY